MGGACRGLCSAVTAAVAVTSTSTVLGLLPTTIWQAGRWPNCSSAGLMESALASGIFLYSYKEPLYLGYHGGYWSRPYCPTIEHFPEHWQSYVASTANHHHIHPSIPLYQLSISCQSTPSSTFNQFTMMLQQAH